MIIFSSKEDGVTVVLVNEKSIVIAGTQNPWRTIDYPIRSDLIVPDTPTQALRKFKSVVSPCQILSKKVNVEEIVRGKQKG